MTSSNNVSHEGAPRATVRVCVNYAEAQRAVDYLSDQDFPVAGVEIVGTDLRLVETVTGRRTYGRMAFAGLVTGAWLGLLIGMFLGLFANDDAQPSWVSLLAMGALWGATFGIVYGLIAHAVTGGRRDFSSRSQLVANQYEVICQASSAQAARDVLASMSNRREGN